MNRIDSPWGERTPYGPSDDGTAAEWPVRTDCHLGEGLSEADIDRWVRSASVLHSNGDGLDIAVKDNRIVGVRGCTEDRINRGRVDPKDLYGWQANNSPDRLTTPLVRRGGELVESDWDTAMGMIVDRSKRLLDGPGGWGRFGFYTSGQLFLEEYYTLAVLGKAGLGTPHMDGNTRLCTATAAAALKLSFGTDGQPGSYTDVDHCDAIALWGHNVAATQTVLWMRMLDRRRGPNPPAMVAIDPRPTPVALEADVHLPVRPGTNLALLNGVIHLLLANGWIDRPWVDGHVIGFDDLAATVERYDPGFVADVCAVDVGALRDAAEIIGTSARLLSTVLQGLYQSNQATAASCQVNNIHLLRAMIGHPGAGIYQMNGQPTSQNTRETGADGDLPGFRNWDNPTHVQQLAELWKVDAGVIPHWAPPTHAMQIFRYAEQGSIELLWVSATNPAVSLPDIRRIRDVLARPDLFVVVQDAFLTETARLADVVLPAAIWGEKTGTFTNVDRTVHISDKAVDPPGAARSDLDIFLDYGRRMDFRNDEGDPLIPWSDPEGAFEAWKACSAGRPCDYTGLTYDKLRAGGGIQWPCTTDAPGGTERIYTDGTFNTDPDDCESYGHDISTGAARTETEYRAREPKGRAFLHAANYEPSPEVPDDDRPFVLTTGRDLFQFHTRTKTGRSPELQAASPLPWVEINPDDAAGLGIADGDAVRVSSARGAITVPAKIVDIRRGAVFVPFHYGYWDTGDEPGPGEGPGRAANELSLAEWDPVSKQPLFKVAAVALEKAAQPAATDPRT